MYLLVLGMFSIAWASDLVQCLCPQCSKILVGTKEDAMVM